MKITTPIRTTIASAVVAALFAASSAPAATLVTYDFEDAGSPFADVANFSGVSVTDLTPGAKIATDDGRSTFTTPTDGGVGSYFARGASLNQPDSGTSDAFVDAQSEGGYIEFTVTADPGQALNLTALNFDAARNSGNTSDMRILVTSDVTGFTFADRLDITEITTGTNTLVDVLQSNLDEIGISPAGAGSAWGNADNTVATLGSEFSAVDSATFRIYAFTRLDASPDNANVMRFDNISVEGTTAGASHYEPFQIGGGQYTESNIQGQNPPNAGFTGAWTGTSSIYTPSTTNTTYQAGTQALTTSGGSLGLDITGAADREVERPMTPVTGKDVFYVSMLMKVDVTGTNDPSNDFMYSALLDSSDNRNGVQFGIIDGDLAIRGRSSGGTLNTKFTVESGYAEETTYLWVLKIETDVVTFEDRITVYLNPTDLSSEGANVADLTQLTGAFVGGYALDEFLMRTVNFGPSSFMFDELRIGDTWSQVLPYTNIPTPAALPAGLLLLTAAAARRRRR